MNILDIAIAKKLAGGGGGSGTDNYNDLSNLPKINDTTLSGNKSSSALGLQSEINSDSKLASDLVDDTNQDNKFVTSTEKNAWNGKQNAIDADHKLSSDFVDDANKTNKFVTSTEKNTWNAKQNAIDSDHKLSSDLVDDANKTNKFVTSTEKNTWNAKQNAIDSDHKLSSSLVSFSTAEAAALASGIDSAKVGQISTNQTNILYAINTGVKNILPVDSCNVSAATYLLHDYEMNVPAGDYIFYINVTSTTATGIQVITSIGADDGQHRTGAKTINLSSTSTGVKFASMTILSGTTCITLYVNNAANIPEIMLCPKQLWDTLDHTFQHGALPNYDLTRLESEDRAALAEVVDSGAKNLAEIPTTQTIGSITFTKDSNEWITSNSATPDGRQWSDANKNVVYSVKAGRYIIYGETASTNTGAIEAYVIVNGSLNQPLIITANSNLTVEVNLTSAGTIGLMYKPYSSNKVRYMICTKAAFGVSQKFVPYRPNYDTLISTINAKAPALATAAMNSGSLDDITTNSFIVCSTNVTSKPITTMAFVRTSVFDANSALQEFYSFSADEAQSRLVYVRDKQGGVWRSWKLLTNT